MTALLTAAQMAELDRLAIEEVGIPALVLMEVAGRAVLDATLERRDDSDAIVLVLAGTGNNGGDGVVVARHLFERGVPVVLLGLGDPAKVSPETAQQLTIAERLGLEARWLSGAEAAAEVAELAASASVVVDGLFGTGLARPVEGWRADVVHAVNDALVPVVAVDLPSGVHADTGQVLGVAMDADVTVTFQCAKLGHLLYPGREISGEVRVVDIGIPLSNLDRVGACATLVDRESLRDAYPPRAANSHKGTYGHVLVIAGAPERPGAALLAARAAQRAGAGLVTLASDAETIRRVAPSLGSLMGLTVGETRPEADRVQDALRTRTAAVIGPSLPADEGTLGWLREVAAATPVPLVLDAGALSALGTDLAWLAARRGPTVLTPHPGEMARLIGTDSRAVQLDRATAATRVAAESGAVVVLKGASTVVATPAGELAIVGRGNPGMATGGTGDVLAGTIGSLLGQGVEPYLAARAGTLLHAAAGDLAAEDVGEFALSAEDVLNHVSSVLKTL